MGLKDVNSSLQCRKCYDYFGTNFEMGKAHMRVNLDVMRGRA